jgi:hypothetical protein
LPEPDFRLSQAIRVIANGGVLAYPTEAVWKGQGLAKRPHSCRCEYRTVCMVATRLECSAALSPGAVLAWAHNLAGAPPRAGAGVGLRGARYSRPAGQCTPCGTASLRELWCPHNHHICQCGRDTAGGGAVPGAAIFWSGRRLPGARCPGGAAAAFHHKGPCKRRDCQAGLRPY